MLRQSGAWRWFKFGCLGVAVVLVLLVAWTAALFGTAYLRGQREEVRTEERSRELPTAGAPAAGRTPAAGRVVLDLTVGEFHVRAGQAGQPLHVEARYDARSYRLSEDWERSRGSAWTYRLTFEETSWFKDGGLRAALGGSFPRIEITLPPDVPLALEGRFSKGGTVLDLGGLWLTEVAVRAEKGGFNLFFDEPLLEPLGLLSVQAKQGGTSLRRIGNASPRRVEIDHRMGGLMVDLQGEWVRDSDVRIVSSMGGANVFLPDNALVEGLEDRLLQSPPGEKQVGLPRVGVSVRESFGEVTIVEPR